MADDQLQAYISRVLELKSARQEELSAEELGAIALELGLTDADLAASHEAAEAHLARGLGYCRHDRWADAVPELAQAVALLPGRLDALEALARAHAGCWRKTGEAADKQAAIRLARRCLTLDPAHEASFQLLNELDPPQAPNARSQARLGNAILVGMAVLAGLLILGLRQWAPPRERPARPAEPPVQTQPQTQTTTADDAELDLPVTLSPDRAAGLVLHARHSRLKRYPDSAFYELGALLENQGGTELSKVRLKAELLGPQGAVLGAEYLDALDTHMARVRPGDKHAFSHLFRTKPDMASLRLTVLLREETPIRKLQSVSRPIALAWAIEKPAGAALSARERAAVISRTTAFKPGTLYFKPVFEIKNEGGETIRTLKVALDTYDAKNVLLQSTSRLAVYGKGLELEPGDTRLQHFIENLPASYHHYRLSVLELE